MGLLRRPGSSTWVPWLTFTLLVSMSLAEAAPPLRETTATLEVELERGRFSGILDVEIEGKNTYRFSAGGSESAAKPTIDSVFWVGSVSKQFGAVAALRLVDQEKLALDAPVKRYLPQIAGALHSGGADCTVAHVLHHTCGLPAGNVCADLRMDTATGQDELIACVGELSLESKPGTKYAYSNVGYDLIGALVEKTAGVPYRDFLKREILVPLGMTSTGVDLREHTDAKRRLIQGQLFNGFGWTDTWPWAGLSPDGLGTNGPSGNVFSTVRDLHTWNRALHGGRVLEPKTYQRLITPSLDDYGLGVGVESSEAGVLWIWHNGSVTPMGWSSFVAYIPSTKTSVVGLANRTRHTSHVLRATKALVTASMGEAAELPILKQPSNKDYAIEMVCFIVPLIILLGGLLVVWQVWRGPRGHAVKWYGKLLSNTLLYFFGIGLFDLFGRATYMAPVAFVVVGAGLVLHRRSLDFDIATTWRAKKERGGLLALLATVAVLLYAASWATRWWFGAFVVVEGALAAVLIVRRGRAEPSQSVGKEIVQTPAGAA